MLKKLFLCSLFVLLLNGGCRVEETPPDPPAETLPLLHEEWKSWVLAHARAVRSIEAGDTDYGDLQFLKESLRDRSLVQLGENGHRIGQFNAAKVRLIKFLHAEMGYDVIAFESGFYECHRADLHAAASAPDTTMRNSIFGVWHSREILPLFEYIQSTRRTARPLRLAGFDIQYSSQAGIDGRGADLERLVGLVEPAYAQEVRLLEKTFFANKDNDVWLAANAGDTKSAYEELSTWLLANRMRIVSAWPAEAETLDFLASSIGTMPCFIDMLGAMDRQDNNLANELRDRGMADNVKLLRETVFPGKKMILWAHNEHIGYHLDLPAQPVLWMGTWLGRWFRPQIYTVGFFFGKGQTLDYEGNRITIAPLMNNSMEAMVLHSGMDQGWIDMLGVPGEAGNAWMGQTLPFVSGGVSATHFVPLQMYDALFFVRQVTPPTML